MTTNKHDFRYVTKSEAAPLKSELIDLIKMVQNEVRDYFTFRFDFIGSSSRNMITYDAKGHIGFDFDVNIEPNDPDGKYYSYDIRRIIFNAFQKCARQFGYQNIENSTSVITIKAIDRRNSRIKYSCDIAIVHHYYKDNKKRQEYIKLDKYSGRYLWTQREEDHYKLKDKINWLNEKGLWEGLRSYYLCKKDNNTDVNKHSRSIFAESINEMCAKYGCKL